VRRVLGELWESGTWRQPLHGEIAAMFCEKKLIRQYIVTDQRIYLLQLKADQAKGS
jgi:hypothetical protein